ncbi:DUF1501 domain-containing protein [Vibrio sp. T187]|uniref:DUF1501 domain-containing protein n=1 Tax=Vibrio TaxID=662 RepID=UPI0010C952B0|nr:DUF1501 domain-containing protein [Vibrio sp. T187]
MTKVTTTTSPTSMKLSRRKVLKALAGVSVNAALGLSALAPTLSFAQTDSKNILIWITLRGAMDGLNVVVPHGDSDYQSHRPSIHLKPSQTNSLDSFFGLHPALTHTYDLYQKGEAAFIHAAATQYRSRSHFDGQKVLENGTSDPYERTGWLNRAIQIHDRFEAIAIDSGSPLILQGDKQVSSWYPNNLKMREQQVQLLEELFQSDEKLSANFEQVLMIENMTGESVNGRQFKALATQAGHFLQSEAGPNIAVLELGGWDTHSAQGSVQGRLANQLKKLDIGISALKTTLGDAWQRTTLIAASEFGRTVEENGTKGTDHGTGNALMLAGGAIKGGKVIANWPGLAKADLYQERDLKPTTNTNDVIAEVLNQHLGFSSSDISKIFPGSSIVERGDALKLFKTS